MDTYTIYLVNQSADVQTFWCFLAPPQQLVADPGVYANSSVSLAVRPNDPGTNTFVIPVQYMVGAGASNQAVGLNVQVVSTVTNKASILQTWNADYVTVPPNEGPTMSLAGAAPANSISIATNAFNKPANEVAGWYSNQSFGIETNAGFLGMTWSPDPQQTQTLTPTLTFYVATGSYGSNALASWDTVSTGSAEVQVPSSFSLDACTVTYTATGDWQITPGAPPQVLLASSQNDTIASVVWDTQSFNADTGTTYLTGKLSVGVALTAAFTYFFLSGVTFKIQSSAPGTKTFEFSYSGAQSSQAIMALFKTGAQITLGNGGAGGRGDADSGLVS